MQPPLAAHLVLEMFHRVGDKGLAARNPGLSEGLIEDAPGGSDERLAGNIFLVAWLLTDQHEPGANAPFAGNDLRGLLVKGTTRAAGLGVLQCTKRSK